MRDVPVIPREAAYPAGQPVVAVDEVVTEDIAGNIALQRLEHIGQAAEDGTLRYVTGVSCGELYQAHML